MRLIDADALIDDIRKHSESYFADDFAHEWVDKQPSADVVEVVRCKDCKLSEHDIDITEHWCCYWDNKTLENGYCSYGERKDDEQNGSID